MVELLLYSLIGAVLAFLLFTLLVFLKMTNPPRKEVYEWTPEKSGYEYMDLATASKDGTKLYGWHIKGGGKGLVIVAHGYTENMGNGSYVRKAIEGMLSRGFDVVVFDFRGHGRSGDAPSTVGPREAEDIIAIIDWAEKKLGAERVALIGYSMGAMASIIASTMDDRIAVVVADSPPPGLPQAIARGLKVFAGLPGGLASFMKLWARLLYKVNPNNYVMWDLAAETKAALMVVVGSKDPLISVDEAKRIVKAAKGAGAPAELFVVDDVGHVETVKHPEYIEKIAAFIEENLATK